MTRLFIWYIIINFYTKVVFSNGSDVIVLAKSLSHKNHNNYAASETLMQHTCIYTGSDCTLSLYCGSSTEQIHSKTHSILKEKDRFNITQNPNID